MAQVRSVTYSYEMGVPAGEVEHKYINKLLRDILPDRAFDLLWVTANCSSMAQEGDGASVEMGKNITPHVTRTEDVLMTFHGDLLFFNHVKLQSEDKIEVWADQIVFPEPVDFDSDDELNMRLFGTNTCTAAKAVGFYVTIGYRAR